MTLRKDIITVAQSDTILAAEATWIALDDTVKEYYIARSSVYIQLNWSCTGIDWTDDETIPDNVREACALYALADFSGNLYTDPKDEVIVRGMLIEETKKLDVMLKTLKYSDSRNTAVYPLSYPDDLMSYSCTSMSGYGSKKLIRV